MYENSEPPFLCGAAVTDQDNLDLVDLPESYTELYGRAQSPHASAAAAAAAAEGSAGHEIDPAVCLVCGQVRPILAVVVAPYVWLFQTLSEEVPALNVWSIGKAHGVEPCGTLYV